MKSVCFVGVLLLIIFVWIYDEISKRAKGGDNSSRNSSSTNRPAIRSKQGYCHYCGEEDIVDELPMSGSLGFGAIIGLPLF